MSAAPLPEQAWDCHVHVVGSKNAYPMLADRAYTPGPASADDLRQHIKRLGLTRAVIVQPSFYGTDNRLLVDALSALGGAGRGVTVLDQAVTDAELSHLHAAGVRGVRINLESTGASTAKAVSQALSAWAGRLSGQGWHLQVYASLDAIASAASTLARLPIPVVLDHFAMIPAHASLDDARVRQVLDLVGSGRAYVKLSASYRISPDPDDADQAARIARLAQAIVQQQPERALWASDWPHTNREPGKAPTEVSAYRHVPLERLQRELLAWFPDDATRRQVLSTNPQTLYGSD